MNTKERILEAAIDLFAERGYADVSIREIARAVGIRESSIYNHFAGKQQILDEIIDTVLRRLDASVLPEEAMAEAVNNISAQDFLQMSLTFLADPAFIKVWRILSIERFTNQRAREVFITRFIDDPMRYQAKVFGMLMDKGLTPRRNPMLLAREFYSYILYIFIRYIETDKSKNPADSEEIRKMILEHKEFLDFAFNPHPPTPSPTGLGEGDR